MNVKKINDGKLYFDGCNTVELAEKYGTPLYVISKNDIKAKIAELKEEFISKYEGARVAFASKALCTKSILKICENEGICIEVVSGGELYTAMSINFPPEKIEFNGNNKLYAELEMAVRYGVGRIIVDGLNEIDVIEQICREQNKKISILFRITPGVKADSHDYMVTGKKDSKFGIPIEDDVLYALVEKAIRSEYIDFQGFHFHVGAQLLDNRPYLEAADIALCIIKNVKERFGYDVKELNVGGGFGINYTDEKRQPYSYYLDPIIEKVKNSYAELNMALPALVIEPGRGLVGEAGLTLYTIGNIKEIKDVRKYVSVDGGMTDLYQAVHKGVIANKADLPLKEKVHICGKCCESGDILIKDCLIPEEVSAGDILAVMTTGAYGYSMASNYNRNPVPAMILVDNGKSDVIVKRQTYEQMAENDILLGDL